MPQRQQVAVIYGGPSAEHDVSCVSAWHVAKAAANHNRTVTAIGVTRSGRWLDMTDSLSEGPNEASLTSPDLMEDAPDIRAELAGSSHVPSEQFVAFPIVHGPYGEDGTIQGHLEALDIPYVGAGVLASAMCMDKAISKSLIERAGLATPRWQMVRGSSPLDESVLEAVATLSFPMFVKPANLGSSIGITKVSHINELRSAVTKAREYDDIVTIEEGIDGREIELALLGNNEIKCSGAGEVVPSREFYDYEDKYLLGSAKTMIPASLSPDELENAKDIATRTYRALRVEGMARIDLFLLGDGSFLVNEVNTVPGFTPISMYPRLWEHEGLPVRDLVDSLIGLAIERHERRRRLKLTR